SYAHTFGGVCAGGRTHHGGLGVQRESVEHHCCFTQRSVSSWVGMDEVGDILWISFPVDDQLCFTNLFCNAITDGMNTNDGPMFLAHHFYNTCGIEDR